MSDSAENGLTVEVAAALTRVPTCGWHHGQYPDLCWWCGLNRIRPIPPEESVPEMLARVAAEEEAHADDTDRPHYRNRVTPPEGGDRGEE